MTTTDSSKKENKVVDTQIAKRLYGFLKPQRAWLVVAFLLTIAIAYLGPIRPYLTQMAVDDYIAKGDIPGLWYVTMLILGALIGESLLLVANTYITRWVGQGALYRLRIAVFEKIQSLNVQYFDRNPIGRLITRCTNDIEALDDLLSNGVVTIMGDMLRIVFILFFMISLSWELTFITMTTLPLLIMATAYFKKKLRFAFLEVRDKISQVNSFIQEHISGMSVVQLFGKEEQELGRFEKINRGHRDAHIETIFYFALFWPVVEVISSLAMALVIWYGGAQALSASVSFGVLLAFIQYTRQFFLPIRDLAEKFNTLQSAFASSERLFSVLDHENPIKESKNSITLDRTAGKIEFKNVWFRYLDDGDYILKDVSFTVEAGEHVAVVGATGAGKTTIINLVTRFYDIQKGEILLDGVNIKDISIQSLRRQFGLVLQENALFSGTVLENITLGNPNISIESVQKAIKDVGADLFINKLKGGLDYELQERGGSLSMGQRQLICFVRALVYDPPILILDEATSSIDSESEELVTKAADILMKNRSSIAIAHRLSTIQHADKILVMHKGEVREEGPHEELLKLEGGIYNRLYTLQYS